MDRRRVLAGTAAIVSLGTAGCTEGTGDDEEGGTPTDSTGQPDAAEDIFVVLHYHVAEQVSVTVTVTAENSAVLEDQVTIEIEEMESLHTGITERGSYELTVSVEDGGESRSTFEFREYDLEVGSNLVVWIDDEIRIGKED